MSTSRSPRKRWRRRRTLSSWWNSRSTSSRWRRTPSTSWRRSWSAPRTASPSLSTTPPSLPQRCASTATPSCGTGACPPYSRSTALLYPRNERSTKRRWRWGVVHASDYTVLFRLRSQNHLASSGFRITLPFVQNRTEYFGSSYFLIHELLSLIELFNLKIERLCGLADRERTEMFTHKYHWCSISPEPQHFEKLETV